MGGREALELRSALPRFERLASLAEVLTVGLPFCAFKLLAGLRMSAHPALAIPGALAIALAGIDGALNLVNGLALAGAGRRPLPICVLHGLLSSRGAPGEVGLAVDMMLAFGLVAGLIAFGQPAEFSPGERSLWSLAVVLNVPGAGGLRLAKAVREAARP
jgi:hypothetical protein